MLIIFRGERTIKGKRIDANEAIISNEQFGKHPADMAVPPTKRDECYQQYLEYADKDQQFQSEHSVSIVGKIFIPENQI